ncbi:MAG: response regulator transcription factor [Myxococcales bacterium]|nr:response regulator transcription factor [Myxococcales bacterium]
MSSLILIVDDEQDLVRTLDYNLKREGFQTRTAGTGQEALSEASRLPVPDLVLLDLMLPDMSGTEVCRRLRAADATRDTLVVMVTAKGEEIDRVVGFEVGADDYVVKPYSVRELMLRVRAILRRRGVDEEPAASASTHISHGILQVDSAGHSVLVEGEPAKLTALEFRLLLTLLHRRGKVQSRETLLSDVWGYAPEVTTRTVDTHVKRLRAKLSAAGALIETIRGVGYCIRDLNT